MKTGLVASFIRLIAGVYLQDNLTTPKTGRIYFANHSSHLDFLVIWAVLPASLRKRTRPVAAADYWNRGALRRYLANGLFRAVLINRESVRKGNNPVEIMAKALKDGEDLILFPEGTRSLDGKIQDFKSGLFHLVREHPEVELVPVYLENLNRILPKGEFLPVPILGRVAFGATLPGFAKEETKTEFLTRCRDALIALAPVAQKTTSL